ncbi:hypothetical protein [endosymbiont DhMRE of Dentiscutata heterogama]|uniref:hypothetical protein n=1 Tax=endosymbiont DhMRE of Dentiscutata heterogama TaxID=1609546 RepID=UPI002AD53F92|nr:hypothetical protein [endosymbiont DhMRE of Dentiscutata heterogama]
MNNETKPKKPVLKPLPVECSYQNRSFLGEYPCQKSFEIKYNRGYGGYVKRNIWGYWTEKKEDNNQYICNTCLLKMYEEDKYFFWENVSNTKKRKILFTYVNNGSLLLKKKTIYLISAIIATVAIGGMVYLALA